MKNPTKKLKILIVALVIAVIALSATLIIREKAHSVQVAPVNNDILMPETEILDE